jgi:hypothetical protein
MLLIVYILFMVGNNLKRILILFFLFTNLYSQNYDYGFFPKSWFQPSFDHSLLKNMSMNALEHIDCYNSNHKLKKSIIISINKHYDENVHKSQLGQAKTTYVSELLPDLFNELPEYIRAEEYSEIKTVILFLNTFEATGRYGGRYGRKFSYIVETEVLIIDKPSNCLIAEQTFRSGNPPESIGSRTKNSLWQRTGKLPEDEMLRFILNQR